MQQGRTELQIPRAPGFRRLSFRDVFAAFSEMNQEYIKPGSPDVYGNCQNMWQTPHASGQNKTSMGYYREVTFLQDFRPRRNLIS